MTSAPDSASASVTAERVPLAEELAAFATAFTLDGLPAADRLLERVRWHVLDSAGLALSSWRADDGYAQKLVEALAGEIGGGPCTIIGSAERAAAPTAALVNGSLVHGADFDDIDLRTVMHCEAFATAALGALAERDGIDGRSFAEAWIVAVEVAMRMAAGANGSGGLFSAGFHNTSVFGTFGAAAGCARLYGLDTERTAQAFALAVSFASGTSVGWLDASGRNKPVQAGWAARSGMFAADLARAGYSCSLRTLDGPRGLFDAHASKDGWALDAILDGLGSEWRMLGLAIKQYPCGAMIQATAECTETLVAEHAIAPDEFLAGTIRVPEQFWPVVVDMGASLYRPPSGFTMIGSFPCVAACILLHGRYGLEHMGDATAHDPALLDIADRLEMVRDDDPTHALLPLDERPATVTLETSRGTFSHTVDIEAGHPRRLGRDRVIEKYRRNAALLVDSERAGAIETAALNVDDLASMRELTGLLRLDG
jgi:2-methylcitrate dehydratase PrpD